MNAAPGSMAGERPREQPAHEDSRHALWGWIAIGVLAMCWLAEGALCAARGF